MDGKIGGWGRWNLEEGCFDPLVFYELIVP